MNSYKSCYTVVWTVGHSLLFIMLSCRYYRSIKCLTFLDMARTFPLTLKTLLTLVCTHSLTKINDYSLLILPLFYSIFQSFSATHLHMHCAPLQGMSLTMFLQSWYVHISTNQGIITSCTIISTCTLIVSLITVHNCITDYGPFK